MEGKHLFAITFQFHYGLRRNGCANIIYSPSVPKRGAINKLASKASAPKDKRRPSDYRQIDDKHEGVIMEMMMRLAT